MCMKCMIPEHFANHVQHGLLKLGKRLVSLCHGKNTVAQNGIYTGSPQLKSSLNSQVPSAEPMSQSGKTNLCKFGSMAQCGLFEVGV